MSLVSFRVVPTGAIDDDDDNPLDLDQPADLVAVEIDADGGVIQALDRRSFETGHQASTFLCEVLRK